MAPSRDGHGLSTEVSLAVPPESLGFWSGRLQRYGVKVGAPEVRFGEQVLPMKDTHGLGVALVESASAMARPFTPVGRESDSAGASDSRFGNGANG